MQEELLSASLDNDIAETKYESVVPMTLTKIAPKPVSTTKAVPGQIVVIQRPGGSTQQIRIAGNSNTPSPNGPIKLIKTADGKFLRISSTKKPAVPPSTNSSVQVKRIISKNNAGQIVATTAQTVQANTSPTPTGVKRTFTVAQAQQMGLISSSKLKELVSQATAQKQAKLSTPQSPDSKSTTGSKVVAQKVIIQTSSGEQKQVSLPPNLIKLAQSGQIKAVNVAGKGIQYVRVVGTNSSANTTSSATTTIAKPAQQTVKVTVPTKVFVHNKSATNQNANAKYSVVGQKQTTVSLAIGSNVVRSTQDPLKNVVQKPSTSKATLNVKEEDSQNDSTDRTHFVLVTKPKFIKVESGNDNASTPRKTQSIAVDTEDEDDIVMKAQSPDEGVNYKKYFALSSD